MSHDYDVLLLGGYFCDLIFTGLPEMPRLGAEVYGSAFDMVPGAAFTTAVALRRLNLRVGWACDFGDDFFSQFVLDAARREGLDSSLFDLHSGPVRRVTAAMSFPHERAFVSFVDPLESSSPIPAIERHRPRVVLFTGLWHGPEHVEICAAAHRAGALVYMDCQCVSATLATPGLAESLRSVDIFAPNASEALQLTGAVTVEDALAQLAALTPLVIVKRGAEGALAQAGERVARAPGIPVDVFDTTGAGDCFNAGFLYGHLRGWPLEASLRSGNICGGLSTTARGGAAAPSAAQVEEWLRAVAT
jgi:sugar/nucleoside kinase (ribokinase family)